MMRDDWEGLSRSSGSRGFVLVGVLAGALILGPTVAGVTRGLLGDNPRSVDEELGTSTIGDEQFTFRLFARPDRPLAATVEGARLGVGIPYLCDASTMTKLGRNGRLDPAHIDGVLRIRACVEVDGVVYGSAQEAVIRPEGDRLRIAIGDSETTLEFDPARGLGL